MTNASMVCAVPTHERSPQARVWAHVPGANGHAIAPDGTHVVMSSTGAFLRLNAGGCIVDVIATHADGSDLVYPNDVALDPHRGGFYATDSGYKETPKRISGEAKGRIVRVDARGNVSVVAGDIAYANGVALSPDGRTLYTTASTVDKIFSYPVRDDGTLGERVHVADVPTIPHVMTVPDGITMNGRLLLVAHYGAGQVLVYEPDGTLVRTIASGNRCTSHVAIDAARGRGYVSGGIKSESGKGAIFVVAI
jgi:gluconolactonase